MKILILSAFLAISFVASAQDIFGYDYSPSGNRINRTLDISYRKGIIDSAAEESDPQNYNGKLALEVTPSPSLDVQKVHVLGLGNQEQYSFALFSLDGKKVLEKSTADNTFELNFVGLANGIYCIVVRTSEKTVMFKTSNQ